MTKNYKNYVCPKCWEKITKCNCETASYTLIGIDEKIQYAIKNLNQKRYYTQACCEGHYYGHDVIAGPYIAFRDRPKTAPIGWKIEGMGIYNKFYPKHKSEFKTKQKEAINQLNIWVDSLEDKSFV